MMSILIWFAKLILAIIAIGSLLLFICSIIKGITNPNIGVDDNGNIVDTDRNARTWFGVITTVAWALLLSIWI